MAEPLVSQLPLPGRVVLPPQPFRPSLHARDGAGPGAVNLLRFLTGLGPGAILSAEAMKELYDTLVIGAGPGGIQAAIYLARYCRRVLILDRTGGRTWHAKHIENFFAHPATSGPRLIQEGLRQAQGFGALYERAHVLGLRKGPEGFLALTADGREFQGRFVLVSTGATENLPQVEGLHQYFAQGIYTCVDCDGYHTRGKRLLIMGASPKTLRLALAMKNMYTPYITVLLTHERPMPQGFQEALASEGIQVLRGSPARFLGDGKGLQALELSDGRVLRCQCVMLNYGYRLNDECLKELSPERDARGLKYKVGPNYESSVKGLYIVGPLVGNDQVAIAAGEGAVAAIDINKRLLELYAGV